MKVIVFFVAIIILGAEWQCNGSEHEHEHGHSYQIFPLRMKTGPGGHYIPEVSCKSWRLGVEAHNVIDWRTIPQDCEGYIGNYMLGHQYRSDSKTVCREAYFYAKTINITAKTTWVFDVDETTLSNLPYYADHGFGYDFLLFVYVIVSYLLTVNYINFLRFKEIIPVRLSSFFDTPTHFS